VLHRGDELHDQLAGVLADDGGAEDAVLAGTVSTLTMPWRRSSAMARSSSSMP
jgi:hypothetical protein